MEAYVAPLNCAGADDIFAKGVINCLIGIFFAKVLVADPLVGAKQADFVGNGRATNLPTLRLARLSRERLRCSN